MRKKGIILSAVAAGIVLLFVGVLFLLPFQTDTGMYIAAGDTSFIVFDNGSGEPVIMLYGEEGSGMPSRLKTGDRILIVHNGTMMLSYPAQINVVFCIRLKKGDVSDVPENVLKTLEEMGWRQGGSIGQNQ